MGVVLNKDSNATLAAIEAFPKSKVDSARDNLLAREVLDKAELLEPPNNIVVGEDSALVLSRGAICHQPILVQRHHHICTLLIYVHPQSS